MSTITVSLPSDGDTIDAADYNTPINTIVNDYNGNINGDNIAAGSITNAKLNTTAGDIGGAWKDYVTTLVGFSGTTSKSMRYTQIGKTVILYFSIGGTSNSTSFTATLPIKPKYGTQHVVRLYDNGLYSTNPGLVITDLTGGGYLVFYKDLIGGAFTNSGTKAVEPTVITYEAA